MADGPEGYVSGLIWESRHADIPEDAIVLKIEVIDAHKDLPMALVVQVLEGPEDLRNGTANLVPIEMSSCVGLGRLAGYVVVKKQTVEFDQLPGITFHQALDYLPHPTDRSKGFKRKDNWFVPGKPAPAMSRPWEE